MQQMQVDPKRTRDLLRAVVKGDKEYILKLIDFLHTKGGMIGRAPLPKLLPLKVIDTSVIGCSRLDLQDNTDFFKLLSKPDCKEPLDGDYGWNYDMVFLPFEP